jgi:uncharacterized protein YjbI with pentapeptide repeats
MIELLIETVENWKESLENVNFYETNLQKAHLPEANLEGAGLDSANLKRTDLTEANLQRVNLWKVYQENFTKSEFINQLCEAKTLWQAILDPELKKQVRETCPHLLKKPTVLDSIAN